MRITKDEGCKIVIGLLSRGQATTFVRHASGFSTILVGGSLRGIADNEHAAKLPEYPAYILF